MLHRNVTTWRYHSQSCCRPANHFVAVIIAHFHYITFEALAFLAGQPVSKITWFATTWIRALGVCAVGVKVTFMQPFFTFVHIWIRQSRVRRFQILSPGMTMINSYMRTPFSLEPGSLVTPLLPLFHMILAASSRPYFKTKRACSHSRLRCKARPIGSWLSSISGCFWFSPRSLFGGGARSHFPNSGW